MDELERNTQHLRHAMTATSDVDVIDILFAPTGITAIDCDFTNI